MPTRENPWPTGTPCWVDLSVPDLPRAVEFYSAVLGWTFVDIGPELGNYHIAQVDGRPAAGIGPIMQAGQPSFWTVFLASDDVDATGKLIAENGGSLLVEPMDVPGQGRMVVASDPTGAVFGVWQAGGSIGTAVYNEPGGLTWEDARLVDPEAGRQFYTDVFDFTYQPVPGAPDDYRTFHAGGDPLGGIGGTMGAAPGTPSHWLAYFAVADADAAVAAATQNGGTVLGAPFDTPYGRMAMVTDPFGAPFALVAVAGTS